MRISVPYRFRVFISILILYFGWISAGSAQDSGQFIYGKIIAKSGQVYEGFMRWGGEEIAWHDIFNSTKAKGQYKADKKQSNSLWGDFDWSIGSLWKDKYQGSEHTFACRFGDIAFLYNRGKSKVDVELKNGSVIKVDGGSNDIGATIRMRDYELGNIKIEWKNIRTVSFLQSPDRHKSGYENLLYGSAKTRKGQEFIGFIVWDQDERMGGDILDGENREGDQEIPFANIVSIEKIEKGSDITFKSGRRIHLKGSNDVSNGNRGIAIYQKNVGHIEIPWSSFESMSFTNAPVAEVYDDYPLPKALEGFVTLYNGEVYEGQIIFDLDEIWDLEFLDGEDDYLHYEVPFRNISRIVPKNRSYSQIYLRNGDELLLGDSRDVSHSNGGLMIVTGKKDKPVSIDWDDISEIVFK